MPRIDTQQTVEIDNILEMSGIKQKKDQSLESKLKINRLDTDSLLQELGNIVGTEGSNAVRLQALKMAAQINPETRQAMNDEHSKQIPTVNIIINDSRAVAINPILLPRELTQ